MTSLQQLKRFEARISLFKSLDCPLALAAAGRNQRFTRYPPVINHNQGWCNSMWYYNIYYHKSTQRECKYIFYGINERHRKSITHPKTLMQWLRIVNESRNSSNNAWISVPEHSINSQRVQSPWLLTRCVFLIFLSFDIFGEVGVLEYFSHILLKRSWLWMGENASSMIYAGYNYFQYI